MSKLRMGLLSLLVLVVFSAITTSASAETTLLAEWLVGGVPVAALTSTEDTGKVLFGDAKIGIKMECEPVWDGSIGPNGEVETTELLSGGIAVTLTKKLACLKLGNCEKPEMAPESLPWLSQAEQLENGTFGVIISNETYYVVCTILGLKTEEECTITNGLFLIQNGVNGVEPVNGTKVTPDGHCTIGGAEAGEQVYKTGDLMKTLAGVLAEK